MALGHPAGYGPHPNPTALPTGTLPNIARNAIINCGELVTYDLIKDTLLRAQLMTGEDGTEVTAPRAIPVPKALTSVLPHRQRPLSLRGCFWGRILRHGGGVTGGCGEDAVHECQPWAVPECAQLPAGPADAGRHLWPLQGVSDGMPPAGLCSPTPYCHHGTKQGWLTSPVTLLSSLQVRPLLPASRLLERGDVHLL